MQLTMGKALALIFTGCGIMLLCNFCIFFLVDNVRKNRNRNRGSIIRKRSNRRKSVSFTNPLVKQTVGQSNPSPGEEIEMVDLGSSRAQSNPPPPAPTPLPPSRPTSTIPPQPMAERVRAKEPASQHQHGIAVCLQVGTRSPDTKAVQPTYSGLTFFNEVYLIYSISDQQQLDAAGKPRSGRSEVS